ncbi:MAG: hypothetical protein ACLFTT_12835, partial [Candidatus Hydrogenedentota bacterium]
MMIRAALTLLLAMAAQSITAQPDLRNAYPVGPDGRLFGHQDVDALLARPYEEHVPMACVGEALWAGHPPGWAFANDIHFYLHGAEDLGFDVTVRAFDRSLEPDSATAYPSHVALERDVHLLRVRGAKWITPENVMMTRLVLDNLGGQAVFADIAMAVANRNLSEEEDGTLAWSSRVAGMPVHVLARAPGFEHTARQRTAHQFWAEGENAAACEGSKGPDKKAAASGGAVLGSGFGGDKGDHAQWTIRVEEALTNAVLSIRYARAVSPDAPWRVCLDEDQEYEQPFASTPGWGSRERDFHVVRIPVGDLGAGAHTVRLEARANEANVNIDMLAIHSEDAQLAVVQPRTQRRTREIKVPAEAQRVVIIGAAAALDKTAARTALEAAMPADEGADPLAHQTARYKDWLTENVPGFQSENHALEKQYWHRVTSVLRKNLFKLGAGRLTRWAMAEGRWQSNW